LIEDVLLQPKPFINIDDEERDTDMRGRADG
jgi:hypothetical protein